MQSKVYHEIFGSSEYGKSWVYSGLHPFFLGQNCRFAITFFSGVAIDMMKIGVPTIEYLDIRGMKKYDNKKSLRNDGYPILGYRDLGFVYGASDLKQFEFHVKRIMDKRKIVNKELAEKYFNFFTTSDKVSQNVAKEIHSSF